MCQFLKEKSLYYYVRLEKLVGLAMSTFSCGLNTGSYFGNGYTYSNDGTETHTANSTTRVASSVNLSRVARDIAQGYNQDIEIVNLYLRQGNISQALISYDNLVDMAKITAEEYGYSLTDSQIASIVNQSYYNTTGTTFVSSIEGETHSPFVTGLIEGLPVLGWFFGQSYSNAEATSKVAGVKTRAVDKFAECAGAALPGAAIGLYFGGPVGAAIGAVAGVTVALFKGAIDKN